MITLRKNHDRGNSQLDWLNSFHTFSFAQYYDPRFIRLGPLRVINEDIIQPDAGFGKHPHQNMEIMTYVIEGALEHKDGAAITHENKIEIQCLENAELLLFDLK